MNIIRKWFFRRNIKFALKLLGSLDNLMKNAGISRQQRRQFWREIPNSSSRNKAIKQIAKRLNIQGGFYGKEEEET